MKWQGREVDFGLRETRSSGYTDRLTQLLVSQASTVTETDPSRTGALEVCAGIWGRAFASVKVEPQTAAQVLSPNVLNLIGRQLIRQGEVLFRVQVVNGQRVLTPSSAWDVSGGADPSTWRFTCSFSGPDSEEEASRWSWDETVFLTWATEPESPI